MNLLTNCTTFCSFKRMALRWHPDKNLHAQDEATEQMKKVTLVYSVLNDGWCAHHSSLYSAFSVQRRAIYDAQIGGRYIPFRPAVQRWNATYQRTTKVAGSKP